jgi:transcriptional regulator with XRE-family HTH domain
MDADMSPDASATPGEFAVWLRQAMLERGISGAALARLVNEQLADGHFAASNISHYLAGRSRPRPAIQDAITRALASPPPPGGQQVTPSPAGLPGLAVPQDTTAPPLKVEDLGDGRARLVINQTLPWPDVLKVLELLKVGDRAG